MQTSAGEVLIDLFQDEAPITVNNFIFLAKEGFYDGVIFHRIIPQFMIQGGDPLGMGVGGPGYSFEDEINEMKLVEGSLAMANSGPNTNGSQFFIVTLVETPWLDGLHTNFGQVIEGLDVVHQIESVPTGANDKPVTDVVILSVEIIEE
ncbi:peptidylprolyl isomerase [candidate division WWE3 bacterium]|nr:peptidylprolyl isomerase [candidate division WWE3 bacterium]MBT7350336.1 peptidylprolyl isomerase [candidate division WWE3 bacterium]